MSAKTDLPAKGQATNALAERVARYPLLDPDDIDERTLLKTLSAETAEDILASPDTEGLRDITGEPFYLVGIEGFLPSNLKDHEDEVYALLTCRRDDGTQFTASTGSKFAITRAIRMDELGLLPRRVVAVSLESKNDPNRSSLWLVDAPLFRRPNPGPVIDAREASGTKTDDGATEEPF